MNTWTTYAVIAAVVLLVAYFVYTKYIAAPDPNAGDGSGGGSGVSKTCSPTCVNGTCDATTGTCACSPGWSGAACTVATGSATSPANPTSPTNPAPTYLLKSTQCGSFLSATSSSSALSATGTKFFLVYSTKNNSRFQLYQTVGASYQVLGSSSYSANASVSLYGPPASGVFSWWTVSGSTIVLCYDDANGQSQSGALCLNVTGGQCGAGTEVHLYTPNDSTNQANFFSLVPS